MQSHHSSFGPESTQKHGHRRTTSIGKAMPVTSLLLNFPPPTMSTLRSHHTRDGLSPEYEQPPMYFPIDEMPPTTSTNKSKSILSSSELIPPIAESTLEKSSSSNQKSEESEDDLNIEQDYEILVSECSSEADGNGDPDEENISLIGNSIFYTPCLTCTGTAPNELAIRSTAINEMCRRLCTDECRLRLSLAGFEPPSEAALKSKEVLAEYIRESLNRPTSTQPPPPLQHTFSEETIKNPTAPSTAAPPLRPPSCIAIQRKKFLTEMLTGRIDDSDSDENSDDSHFADEEDNNVINDPDPELFEIVSSIVDDDDVEAMNVKKKSPIEIDAHELALLKDFREKFEIAEALAKTSAMTSTSKMKQRLAARKLEMELDNANVNANAMASAQTSTRTAAVGADTDSAEGGWCVEEQGVAAAATAAAVAVKNATVADAWAHFNADADIVATTTRQNGSEWFEPPRDLLLYLVRMGSFNSAPKINNIDCQDDGLKIPNGLSNNELLQHVQQLRGDHQPPLLNRYFLKPSLAAQMVANDITDGLRSLKLNSISRVCSAPISSPNHIRLLQWNILSQTLGQNNDNFVRCPDEALTWENRKFLIVQEILQNNPDVICLQEVDHFKFLQNILGTQNYEGIFFPKPDSPCLYVEQNNGPDGCAIFYKRDKFELKNFDTRILEVWRVQSNQVAIAANLLVKASGQELCVCTTHLKARHGSLLSKLRNEQGRDLVRFVKQFAGDRPVLLCGDFNAEPIEPVYTTILNCDMLKLSSAYADLKTESDECNNDNDSYSAEAEAEEADEDTIQKSIEREPPYTTWKIREDGEVCHTIDYVFYSKDHLKVKNCLEFPHGDEIGHNRTPSFQYPSDHFSLVCDFEILDTQEQPQQQKSKA